jgi:hypothetical protein
MAMAPNFMAVAPNFMAVAPNFMAMAPNFMAVAPNFMAVAPNFRSSESSDDHHELSPHPGTAFGSFENDARQTNPHPPQHRQSSHEDLEDDDDDLASKLPCSYDPTNQ